ncbi:MAG: Rieske (2Fe-2S) protein [Micrococcales bacterium]
MTETNNCQNLCETSSQKSLEGPRNSVIEVRETAFGHSRRTALKGIAAILGAVGLGSMATVAQAASKTYSVCKTSDVPVGSAQIFAVNSQPVVITQPKKGTFKAFSGWCTHQQSPLSPSAGSVQTSGSNMVCFRHGAQYSTTTGAATGGPGRGSLAKFTVKVVGTQISVTV